MRVQHGAETQTILAASREPSDTAAPQRNCPTAMTHDYLARYRGQAVELTTGPRGATAPNGAATTWAFTW